MDEYWRYFVNRIRNRSKIKSSGISDTVSPPLLLPVIFREALPDWKFQ